MMHNDTFTRAGRAGALAAAPLGFILLVVAFTVGGAEGKTMATPAVVAANVAGLAATIGLLLGLVWAHLHTRAALDGRGGLAMTIAVIGAGLVVGSAWSSVFVAPAMELAHPGLTDEPLSGVIAGYIVSHVLLGLGVLGWAVVARRAGVITKAAGTVLGIGGIVCLAPLPGRFFVVTVGLLLVAIRAHEPHAAQHPANAMTR
jgi:general nucleoside transport system permease protein